MGERVKMAGNRETQKKANHTLVTIANILNEEKMNWNETILNLPKNSVSILKKMYGENWKTPISYGDENPKWGIYNLKKKTII